MNKRVYSYCIFLIILNINLTFGSSNFNYKYKRDQLIIKNNDAIIISKNKKYSLQKIFNEELKNYVNDKNHIDIQKKAILTSLIGPYASFRIIKTDLIKNAKARPVGYVYMQVFDLNNMERPSTPVSLLDFYSEKEIWSSLVQSKDIEISEAAKKCDQTFSLNTFKAIQLPNDGDFLYEFSFGGLKENKLTMNLQLHSPGFGDGLEADTFYHLDFNIPEKLRHILNEKNEKSFEFFTSQLELNKRPFFKFH